MEKVLNRYGFSINRNGFCSCPFHGEAEGSFKVYKSSFYCFGCHKGGDIITFAELYFEIPFQKAIERLMMISCLA